MNLSIEAGELKNIHETTLLTNLNYYPPAWRRMLLKNYTKVMFTRHPLQRLISAYRDKFLYSDNEQYYKKTIASVIKTKFRKSQTLVGNVTFPELVRYILKWKPSHSDIHWRPMFELCDSCNIQYDFLGKFETLQEDADHVLKRIGAPKGLQFPNVIAYANEARTSARITEKYLKKLTSHELQRLLKIYHLDFTIFNYPIWHNDTLQED
ncbi:hypothetical protein NDU88_001349 [Pleurodeles waltl]|uniref:Carbohydrate sulfotransferase n=2 Tax=Pleurodeles waltl TaxID=8319 RepID=A0AAV7MLG7_PLEWA|nr:hypothetical protein NDU88_001349 [Pleurodeles waltl]